ncbi:SorA family sulfite dehydrogenase catalytic subunit [Microbulbifer pacificus]|uniref:Molybdopterin-dependent oxidoreductase n=1 Tax=Microbulbifer pacificus TaxID=407164 RepID=A0AAU0N2T5_9GAMM|nr:molybdopterin-dependent oxidoreductase [Microbulbifer pacificus]WOX07121.1 molybdopterin-dependent oxidoreductase [Microbulbifer pacificus]
MGDHEDSHSNWDVLNASRRRFLGAGAALGGLAFFGRSSPTSALQRLVELPMSNGQRELVTYPQKRELIRMTARPVQLETPMSVFNEGVFTPNDAFFVRWHLAGMPTSIDERAFRIKIHGRVRQPIELTIDDLKNSYEPVEIAAVCQCAGNSRGLFNPRVAGGQWGNGAMGNALWKGVRLRDILQKAGIESGAAQVRFNGADGPVLPSTPDFIKSLDMDIALSPDVIVAYSMNGAPLPLLNGYPVRLVVPGWYATYWVKMLNDIEVIGEVDESFWMKPAYRIPDNPCACTEPGKKGGDTIPINRMVVRSFITSVADGAALPSGRSQEVNGIAFDGGFGIARVMLSTDGGKTWAETKLGKDHGKYSFREWRSTFTPKKGNHYELASMAVNTKGESQRLTPRWNPSGYMRNVVEILRVTCV